MLGKNYFNIHYDNTKHNINKIIANTMYDSNGDDIHAKLNLIIRNQTKQWPQYAFRTPIWSSSELISGYKNAGDNPPNYVVANIGFIVSNGFPRPDHSHGRKFVTFPITVNNNDICYWNYRTNDDQFTNIIRRRNKSRKVHDFRGIDLNHNYGHGEQALVNYMESDAFMSQIIMGLNRAGITPGHKVYGIILDLHSVREMCHFCQETMEYLMCASQEDQDGFLWKLKSTLSRREHYYVTSKHAIYMAIRVSADTLYTNNRFREIHEHDEKNYSLQHIGRTSSTTPIILQRHNQRGFFDDATFNKQFSAFQLQQTIFCSGSQYAKERARRVSLPGEVSLASLTPENPYPHYVFEHFIRNSVPLFNKKVDASPKFIPKTKASVKEENKTTNVTLTIAEYICGPYREEE